MKKLYILIIFLIVAGAAIFIFTKNHLSRQANQLLEQNLSSMVNNDVFQFPLNKTLERVTKKPFGIYVMSQNSPVQPEKFTGYHAAVDFEIFPEEENINVEIKAICTGPIIFRNFVSGYGGVAVQACKLNNQDITVLYGHLKLSSISNIKIKDFPAGQSIGILGKGFSQETDGERKHLHLGIHLGKKIDFLGYVQNKNELANWVDATEYFPK